MKRSTTDALDAGAVSIPTPPGSTVPAGISKIRDEIVRALRVTDLEGVVFWDEGPKVRFVATDGATFDISISEVSS